MRRRIISLFAAAMLAGTTIPVLALDGHGNAEMPERAVPNTGNISGGPTHRNDPRVRESQEIGRNGKPIHHDNDGHAHGHSHGKK